jgi:hypothetical protein
MWEDERMTTIRYWTPLERAFERMRRMLFEPFDLGLWLVVGFSAWLARLVDGSSAGGNFWGGDSNAGNGFGRGFDGSFETFIALTMVVMIAVIVLAVIVALLWVSSRGKFMYLDNAVHARAQIVEPWNRFRSLGNSLFFWRLGFMLTWMAAIGLIVLVLVLPAAAFDFNEVAQALSFMAIATGVILVALVAIAATYIGLFLDSFVVPIMYRYELRTTEAWKALMPWMRARPGSFFLYGLFVLLLLVAFMIVSLPVCLVTCCGCIPYVGTVILLPLLLTYRMFTIEWLAQFHPDFDLFAAAEAEAPIEEPSVEPEPYLPPPPIE